MVNSNQSDMSGRDGPEREVVVLMTDMVHYSQVTANMRPEEVRDFILDYHGSMAELVEREDSQPVEIEPLAGDGALIIFDPLPGEDRKGLCGRALRVAVRMAMAMEEGRLAATRMGLCLGQIIEARLGQRNVKFGSSLAVAARLEELCGYFGTALLMDDQVAANQDQRREGRYVTGVGKLTLRAFSHPMYVHTVYQPGMNGIPADVDEKGLLHFIDQKNRAINHFCGNDPMGIMPDFPLVRELLGESQALYVQMTGRSDQSSERILEYIREKPAPDNDFSTSGMRLSDKKRDSIGARLFHLSCELLKAINHEFYHALVVDTGWEKHFKLEWRKKGETIITIHDPPNGVFFIDSGEVVTLNESGEEIAILSAGTIFGEMAYFSQEKRRNATVVAHTDVVIRRISSEDFEKLPVIMKIFEQIAMARS